jgi:hypothetical protein
MSAGSGPASDYAARPGSCRKPPGALYAESGKEWVPSFPFIVGCGRATSSRTGAAPHQRWAGLAKRMHDTEHADGDTTKSVGGGVLAGPVLAVGDLAVVGFA